MNADSLAIIQSGNYLPMQGSNLEYLEKVTLMYVTLRRSYGGLQGHCSHCWTMLVCLAQGVSTQEIVPIALTVPQH